MNPRVSIVVAIGKNRELGKNGQLLWHIPEDMKRFKTLTMGHPVIMGRKTFESIPPKFRPLPGRTNIVLSRTTLANPGVIVVGSLEDALVKAKELDTEEVHIGGGAEIYKQALPFVDRLYLTLIDAEADADTYFPEYEKEFTKKLTEELHDHDGLQYRWVTLEK
ncbi:MAG: dihydrofolate reductase [Patescibacteria group bacterium]